MEAAFGVAATQAAGLKSQFGTMGKPLNAGLAARAGVEAANWARSGMTGADAGLEAFGNTHHGAGADVPFAWRMEAVSHKYHACCHGLHAALEALGELSGLADLKAQLEAAEAEESLAQSAAEAIMSEAGYY